jgi:hypothetical protein
MTRLRGALVVIVAATLVAGHRAQASPTSQPLPEPSQGRCPKLHMQRLPGDAVARAALAALDQAPVVYRGTNLKGIR